MSSVADRRPDAGRATRHDDALAPCVRFGRSHCCSQRRKGGKREERIRDRGATMIVRLLLCVLGLAATAGKFPPSVYILVRFAMGGGGGRRLCRPISAISWSFVPGGMTISVGSDAWWPRKRILSSGLFFGLDRSIDRSVSVVLWLGGGEQRTMAIGGR